MVVGRYRLYYDDHVGYFCRLLWRAPSFKNAILVAEVFRWLIYSIVMSIATVIIAPFLVLYSLRISDLKKE